MSLIFADHTRLTAAAAKVARTQAEFKAAADKCNAVMLPLHAAVEAAKTEFEVALDQCANDEATRIDVDLTTAFNVAETNRMAALEAARVAYLVAAESANEAPPEGAVILN